MRRYSPYNYAFDNPIRFIDPDGTAPIWNGQHGTSSAYYDSETGLEVEWEEVLNYMDVDGSNKGQQDDGKKKKGAKDGSNARDESSLSLQINEVDPLILAKAGKRVAKGSGDTKAQTAFVFGLGLDIATAGASEFFPKSWLFKLLPKNWFGNIAKTGSELAVQFGKTENQIYHVFRHTDALGLDRSFVQSAIQNHFKTVSSQVAIGKPFNQIIEIGGQKIQYTVFKLPDGKFNIGRIHGVK